jgi:large subunit ribosomal protein L25
MELITLNVSSRNSGSTSDIKTLRKSGKIPAIYYGPTQEPMMLSVVAIDFRLVFGPGKRYILLDLVIDGKGGNPAIVYETQKDIMTREVQHIDFMKIEENKEINVTVPVKLEGVAVGVKTMGGSLYQERKTVRVRCKPSDIPTAYTVDISECPAPYTHYVEQLAPNNAKMVTAPRGVIFTISKGRGAKVGKGA